MAVPSGLTYSRSDKGLGERVGENGPTVNQWVTGQVPTPYRAPPNTHPNPLSQSSEDYPDPSAFDDLPDAACEECGEFMDAEDINVEAFEVTGRLLCPECAEAALED